MFLEKPVFLITVLATSVMHCPGSKFVSFATAWNKVDFPVEDGPTKKSVLIASLASISDPKSGKLRGECYGGLFNG